MWLFWSLEAATPPVHVQVALVTVQTKLIISGYMEEQSVEDSIFVMLFKLKLLLWAVAELG